MQLGTLETRPATYRLAVSDSCGAAPPMPRSRGWSIENSIAPGIQIGSGRTRQGPLPPGPRVASSGEPTVRAPPDCRLDSRSVRRADRTRWQKTAPRASAVLLAGRPSGSKAEILGSVWAPTLGALSAAEPTVIAPEGELDITRIGDFRAALWDAAREGAPAVVVDLSHVSFIDSSGLGALVELHNRLRRSGRRLAVVAPGGSAPVVLLDLAGLRGHLPIFETRRAALDKAL